MPVYSPYSNVASATTDSDLDPCREDIGPALANVQLASLTADYTADTLVLADGAPVTSWADSSGNGHTATRASATAPLYSNSIAGGGPVVRFTADTKGLDLATMTLNLRAAATHYMVLRYDPAQNNFGTALNAQSGGGGFSIALSENPGTYVNVHYAGNGFPSGPVATCGWQVIAWTCNFAGNALLVYRNGAVIQTQGFAPLNQATSSWKLGTTAGFTNSNVFDLAQYQVYNAVHSGATVLSHSASLRSRWSIAVDQGV